MQEIYHCTPRELDEQDDAIIQMHISFLRIQGTEAEKDRRRAEQRARNKK